MRGNPYRYNPTPKWASVAIQIVFWTVLLYLAGKGWLLHYFYLP